MEIVYSSKGKIQKAKLQVKIQKFGRLTPLYPTDILNPYKLTKNIMGMESFDQDQVPQENDLETGPVQNENPETLVSECVNFSQLQDVFIKLGNIQGGEHNWTSNELINALAQVRRGNTDITTITRTYGIRAKVNELLEKGINK